MKPHEQRVVDELNELVTKRDALSRFFGSQIYYTLGLVDQGLLKAQVSAMEAYIAILRLRIERFK